MMCSLSNFFNKQRINCLQFSQRQTQTDTLISYINKAMQSVAMCFNIFFLAFSGLAFNCFVCKPDQMSSESEEHEMKKTFGHKIFRNLKLCSEYTNADREEFIVECPPQTNKGCTSKFYAGQYLVEDQQLQYEV